MRKITMKLSPTPSDAVDFFTARLQFQTTPSELKAGLQRGTMILLDVRDKDEFEEEHIPGAINIPLTELTGALSKLPKNKTIVVYCCYTACYLSPRAALTLAEHGFRTQELIGGIEEWKRRIGTVSTSRRAARAAEGS